MEHFSVLNFLYFLLFNMFAFYLSKYKEEFSRGRRIHPEILTFLVTLSIIAEVTFLIYYGFKVVWWAPLVLFPIANVVYFAIFANLFERIFGHGTLIKWGFLGLPVFGFLMFKTIPI